MNSKDKNYPVNTCLDDATERDFGRMDVFHLFVKVLILQKTY